MEISKKFAKNIKEIAKSKKLKLGEIEKNAGVTPGYLSRFDKNENEMRLDTALKFCKAVSMSFEEVMNYVPEIEVEWKDNKLYMKRGKEVVAVFTKEELQASFAKTEKEMAKKLDDLLGV